MSAYSTINIIIREHIFGKLLGQDLILKSLLRSTSDLPLVVKERTVGLSSNIENSAFTATYA